MKYLSTEDLPLSALSFGGQCDSKELHLAKMVDEKYQLHRSSLLKKRCLTFSLMRRKA